MGGGAMHLDLHMIQLCSSTSSSKLPSPSSSSSNLNFPVSTNNNSTTSATLNLKHSCSGSCQCHCDSGQKVDKTEEKIACGSLDNTVFGSVPSKFEVKNAVAALQSFIMHGVSSYGSVLKWLQPLMGCSDPRTLLSEGYGRKVYDTFRMLQTDPSIKRLVISISSDKAVWDAVINNELVRKLWESPFPAENRRNQNSGEEPNMAADILKWILDTTKAKLTELLEKFQALVEEIFKKIDSDQNPTEEITGDLEDKVRSSFLLSIVILVIVVVARVQ